VTGADLKEAFFRVRALPPGEREPAIENLAADDPELGAKLRRMLRADGLAGGPIAPPAAVRMPGSLIGGRYRILRKLAGGLSQVFECEDTALHDRRVVVKFAGRGLPEQFRKESAALAALTHPNVVRIYDSGVSEGESFLVTEFIEGVPLREALEAGPLPRGEVVRMIGALAGALEETHRHGILHLDIKPENVMLRAAGRVPVLIDFGLAHSPGMARVAGSRGYMAPEQMSGRPCEASDVFSLAVMGWEMLTGQRPAAGQAELPEFIGQALAEDVGERTAEPVAFARALAAYVARPRRWWLLAAAAGVAVAAGCGWLWLRPAPFVETRQLISVEGPRAMPTASRDGRRIFYLSASDGVTDVHLLEEGGHQSVRLTRTPEREYSPAASPDGSRVAYIRLQMSDTEPRLLIVQEAREGGAERVVATASRLDSVAWHPNGRVLLVVRPLLPEDRRGDRWEGALYWFDLETGKWRLMTRCPDCVITAPAVSPDGRQVAFIQGLAPVWGSLMMAEVDGAGGLVGAPRRMGGRVMASRPRFSPDGRAVFFGCSPRPLGICRLEASGAGEPVRLRFRQAGLVESLPVPRGLIVVDAAMNLDLRRWERDTGTAKPFLASEANERDAVFSPDGEWVAYRAERDGRSTAWVANAQTRNARELASMEAHWVQWTPDGKGLLVVTSAGEAGADAVVLAVPEGREMGRWRMPGGVQPQESRPRFVADGGSLLYVAVEGGRRRVARLELKSGRVEYLGGEGVLEVFPAPGRAELLLRKDLRRLVLFDPGTGQERVVAVSVMPGRVWVVADGVYYGTDRRATGANFYFQPFAGGERQWLLAEAPALGGTGLTVSPEGRYLVFSKDSRESGDLLLAEGVR